MPLSRFAGDILDTSQGMKKASATVGAANAGFDRIGVLRAIGAQLHPVLGAMDDAANIGQSYQKINQNPGQAMIDTGAGIGSIGGLLPGSIGSALASVAPPAMAISAGAGIGNWMNNNMQQNIGTSGRGAGRSSF